MPHDSLNNRLKRTTDLCDELSSVMTEIQQRLESRRSKMKSNMEQMARGLKLRTR